MGFARNIATAALLVSMISVLCGATADRRLPRYGAFVFSDVCIEPESGDSAGHWIALTRGATGDTLIYSWSEGAMMQPVVADKLTIAPGSGATTFHVQKKYDELAGDSVSFSGTITDEALTGQFSDERKPATLRRVTDFSRKPGECLGTD